MAHVSNNDNDEIISAINVTPLVDVFLVLLIIFMITAPVIYQSRIHVELPAANTGEQAQKQGPLVLTLTKDSELYIKDELLSWGEFPSRLAELKKLENITEAVIQADEMAPHGKVIELLDALRSIEIFRIALDVRHKE